MTAKMQHSTGTKTQSKGLTTCVRQECTKAKREESTELVPEALKNMLLVMASQDILTRDWRVRQVILRFAGRAECMQTCSGLTQTEHCVHASVDLAQLELGQMPCFPGSLHLSMRSPPLHGTQPCKPAQAQPHVQDQEGRSMWDLTWAKAHSISSGLNPGLLSSSGLGPPEPPPAPAASEAAQPPAEAMQTTSAEAPTAAEASQPAQVLNSHNLLDALASEATQASAEAGQTPGEAPAAAEASEPA